MMEFVPFQENHLAECADLYVETFNAPPWNDHWYFDAVYGRLKDIMDTPGFIGCTAIENGKILAAVLGNKEHWYEGKMYSLKEMFVSNSLRGKGIGTQMLDTLNEWLKAQSVTFVYLFTLEGDMTEAFYRKNGYQKIDKMIMMSRDI